MEKEVGRYSHTNFSSRINNRQLFLRTRLVLILTDRWCWVKGGDGSHTTFYPSKNRLFFFRIRLVLLWTNRWWVLSNGGNGWTLRCSHTNFSSRPKNRQFFLKTRLVLKMTNRWCWIYGEKGWQIQPHKLLITTKEQGVLPENKVSTILKLTNQQPWVYGESSWEHG